MIDRERYRANLRTLTDDELVRVALLIWRDIRRGRDWRAQPWSEWNDVMQQCAGRGPHLRAEVERRQAEERRAARQPIETPGEFLDRTNREMGRYASNNRESTQNR